MSDSGPSCRLRCSRCGATGPEPWALAGSLIAVTFMTVRLNIVIPWNLLDPHLRGLENAFLDHRLVLRYVPSWFERTSRCSSSSFLVQPSSTSEYRFLPLTVRLDSFPHHDVGRFDDVKGFRVGIRTSPGCNFLARGAMLGSGLISAATSRAFGAEKTGAVMINGRPDAPDDFADPEHCLDSACLNCNTGCGIKAKDSGWHRHQVSWLIPTTPGRCSPICRNLRRRLTPSMSMAASARKARPVCKPRMIPIVFVRCLSAPGKRGEDKWVTIDFDKAVREIVEGGKLFANVPGEENRNVEGLAGLMALRDSAVAKEMAKDVDGLWNEKDKEKKKALIEEFRRKHAAHLDKLIDPEHPDFGPRNNQFTVMWGRLKGGRSDFIKRFGDAFGTTNLHGHTTVCQGSPISPAKR